MPSHSKSPWVIMGMVHEASHNDDDDDDDDDGDDDVHVKCSWKAESPISNRAD